MRNLTLTSFGHKFGVPFKFHSDTSFDVRSWPSPPKHLRDSQTGIHKPLQEALTSNALFASKYQELLSEIVALLSVIGTEDSPEIFIGCDNGKHRSVVVAEMLSKEPDLQRFTPDLHHRDVDKSLKVAAGGKFATQRRNKQHEAMWDDYA